MRTVSFLLTSLMVSSFCFLEGANFIEGFVDGATDACSSVTLAPSGAPGEVSSALASRWGRAANAVSSCSGNAYWIKNVLCFVGGIAKHPGYVEKIMDYIHDPEERAKEVKSAVSSYSNLKTCMILGQTFFTALPVAPLPPTVVDLVMLSTVSYKECCERERVGATCWQVMQDYKKEEGIHGVRPLLVKLCGFMIKDIRKNSIRCIRPISVIRAKTRTEAMNRCLNDLTCSSAIIGGSLLLNYALMQALNSNKIADRIDRVVDVDFVQAVLRESSTNVSESICREAASALGKLFVDMVHSNSQLSADIKAGNINGVRQYLGDTYSSCSQGHLLYAIEQNQSEIVRAILGTHKTYEKSNYIPKILTVSNAVVMCKNLLHDRHLLPEELLEYAIGTPFESEIRKLVTECGMQGAVFADNVLNSLRLADSKAVHRDLDQVSHGLSLVKADSDSILFQAVRGNNVDLAKRLLMSGIPLSKQVMQELDTCSIDMKHMMHNLFKKFPDLQQSGVTLYGQPWLLTSEEISDHNAFDLLTRVYATNGDQYTQFHGMRALMNQDISVIDDLLENKSQLFYTVCAQYFDTYHQCKQYFEKLDPKYAPFVKKGWFGKGDVEQRFDHAKQDLQVSQMVPLHNFSHIAQKTLKKEGMLSKRTQLPKAVAAALGMNKLGMQNSKLLEVDINKAKMISELETSIAAAQTQRNQEASLNVPVVACSSMLPHHDDERQAREYEEARQKRIQYFSKKNF